MMSPSRMKTFLLSKISLSIDSLSAVERVDFPAPDKPVNQYVAPVEIVCVELDLKICLVYKFLA